MSEPLAHAVRERLASETEIEIVRSAQEFLNAPRDAQTVSFLDDSSVAELKATPPGPVIVICEKPLQAAVGLLPTHPWLSHVVSAALFAYPLAKNHLANVTSTLLGDRKLRLLDWLGADVEGRRVRLTHANKRVVRLERMSEFFESKGVGARTLQLLRDVAEELLTNAFYDAPVAAGAVRRPISRTEDVALPEEAACDLVYGCHEDLALVRLRDPFGALTRERLLQVLARCARTDMQVEVDETMGGAGLGLWRVFSVATFVAISVLDNRHTEVLVGIRKRAASGPRPFAFHLFFKDSGRPPRKWMLDSEASEPSLTVEIDLQD